MTFIHDYNLELGTRRQVSGNPSQDHLKLFGITVDQVHYLFNEDDFINPQEIIGSVIIPQRVYKLVKYFPATETALTKELTNPDKIKEIMLQIHKMQLRNVQDLSEDEELTTILEDLGYE